MPGAPGLRLDMTQGGTDYSTQKYRQDISALSDARDQVAKGAATGPTYSYEGGSPGYMVDNRGAVNAQYNGTRDDANNVYDQAAAAIGRSNANIGGDYDAAAAQDAANRQARTAALQQLVAGQQGDESDWAARMGFAPSVGNSAGATARSNDLLKTLGLNQQNLTSANQGYFGTTKGNALARGQAQVDASNWARKQLQDEIEQARQKALANAVYYVAGSRGRKVSTGGYTAKQAASLNKKINSAESSLISSVQNMLGTKKK